ncbi:hypothetical protein Ciccas_011387 [Cichlidogyrus casuarinus]|uniref:Uncharacterized protein n=1 Tax=Cichlidogyrus casuarinus TaxID=1844966 RepID=A0ABD2PRS6_9PLAT
MCVQLDILQDEVCSEFSSPAFPIETGRDLFGEYHQLHCLRSYDPYQNRSVPDRVVSAKLKPFDGYSNQNVIDELLKIPQTKAAKNNITHNQQTLVIGGKSMVYFAVTYPVKELREFYMKSDECLSAFKIIFLTYITDTSTKQVLRMGREPLSMPWPFYKKYMGAVLDSEAIDPKTGQGLYSTCEMDKIPSAPMELLVDISGLKENSYEVWHVACSIANLQRDDDVVLCAEPFANHVYIKNKEEPKKEEPKKEEPNKDDGQEDEEDEEDEEEEEEEKEATKNKEGLKTEAPKAN